MSHPHTSAATAATPAGAKKKGRSRTDGNHSKEGESRRCKKRDAEAKVYSQELKAPTGEDEEETQAINEGRAAKKAKQSEYWIKDPALTRHVAN